ncbi:TonB-dependent receptor domain-containing protein [Motilimonas eburnea]|uniref:TonB-dependent receptor domain-containing protein n=1 Tax=Motilimonas eburnea TaxID=1737488 RepID=UPI001E652F82|nr:TonB-dependent receptor [Motilimonas eburnea]MCE2571380.1 TonB-dependent receptor [Motilimonas eburnea]
MKKTLLAVALTPLCMPFALAESADDTMIITANRTNQPLTSALAPVVVVEKEEIEASQAKSFAQVLRRLPGIQVNEGGMGQQTDIFVRGASSKHVLLLINGVRIGSATTGAADFGQIPLTGIERIEFIRGPRATIYGSDAIGGVINVITSYQGKDEVALSGSVGSYEYASIETSISHALTDTFWAKLAAKHDNSDGFSSQKLPQDQDDDGFRNTSVVAELGAHINEQWQASLQGYLQQGKAEYDSSWYQNPYSETDNYNVAGKLSYQGKQLFSELTLAANQDKSENKSATSNNEFKTQRQLANWLVSAPIAPQATLTGGLEWVQDKVATSGSPYAKTERDNKAAYVNVHYQLAPVSFEGSARVDDNQSYGSHTTWQMATGIQVHPQVRLVGSVGTAFKAPSFNDLYYPETAWNKGNPDLKPEESVGYDLAIEWAYEYADLRLGTYESRIDDLIIWPAPTYYTPENVDTASIKGVEFQADFATGEVNHFLSYDYVDARDKATNKYLPRRAMHMVKWNINYRFQGLQLDLDNLYHGDSYDDSANTNKVKGYYLADIAASYYFNNGLILRGRVANIFDKKYEVKQNYNTAERSVYATATYRF